MGSLQLSSTPHCSEFFTVHEHRDASTRKCRCQCLCLSVYVYAFYIQINQTLMSSWTFSDPLRLGILQLRLSKAMSRKLSLTG